jgi:adenosine deaminase
MIDPNLPLVDLHRHLDGSIRMETIYELATENQLNLPAHSLDELRSYVQVTVPQPGVMAFIVKIERMVSVLVDTDACRRVAYENVVDAKQEGLDYIELRFSPWFMAEPHQLNPDAVVEAVIDGIQEGKRETGLPVNLIGILSRTYGPENASLELDTLLAHKDSFVGIDLAGDEVKFSGEFFVDHMRRAREAGLQITIHAGEADGAKSIWQAVRDLKAARIGHAVHAAEDPALLDYLAKNAIGIEANLTSNVQTSTVSDYMSHPMRRFLENGLLATLNSDDPGVSGINLRYEYEVAAPAAGLSTQQIRQAQMNGLKVAFLSSEEKHQLQLKKSQGS